MRFAGKVAVVTGAGAGIGRASAQLLAREGAQVAVIDRDEAGARETVTKIGTNGPAIAIRADVSREAEIADAVDQIIRAWGRIDLLHNHAGILHPQDASILEIEERTIDQTLAINVKGQMLVAKHVARAMVRSGGGAIVNTSSDLALIALPGVTAYITSKAAIAGLTRAMAMDLAGHNIRVNAVGPGFVYTNMTTGLAANADLMDDMRKDYLVKRLGQPEDVAEAVAYLLSDQAGFVNGSLLVIDGGHSIH